MATWNQEQIDAWKIINGDRPIPGTDEPEEGKCGASLRNRGIRDTEDFMGIERGTMPKRYCGRWPGHGTRHEGFGPCKLHLGNMTNLEKKYLPMAMGKDLHTISELWEEPVGLDPAPVEAARLMVKIKKTMLVLEQLAVEANEPEYLQSDLKAAIQVRPIFELWERAQDRFLDMIKFCLKYDLEARRVELMEAQARDIAGAVLGVVMNPTLQLTEDQIEQIRRELAKAMQDLAPALKPDWMEDMGTGDYIDEDE